MAGKLRVEFRYFDRSTCSRCRTTDKNAAKVIKDLREALSEAGVSVQLILKKLPAGRIAESNSIFINGRDVEEIVSGKRSARESPCRGCGTLIDGPCNCRAYSFRGKKYRYIPKAMIREAIRKAIEMP